MINMTQQAFELVEELFKDRTDKGGHDYVQHLVRVSSGMKPKVKKTIALLHDVIEDTDTTLDDLMEMGYLPEVCEGVDIISRREGESYTDYIQRIINSGNVYVMEIKLADLEDNMNLDRIPHYTQKDVDRVNNRYKPAHKLVSEALRKLK